MVKNVGLDKESKILLKFAYFSKDIEKNVELAAFIKNSDDYYRCFKRIFGDGSIKMIINQTSVLNIPNFQDFTPALVLYHFSIELLLKALILLKSGSLLSRNHKVFSYLEQVVKIYQTDYPAILKITDNEMYVGIIQQLSEYSVDMRYGKVAICLRGSDNPNQLQDLSEALDDIYYILKNICDNVRLL